MLVWSSSWLGYLAWQVTIRRHTTHIRGGETEEHTHLVDQLSLCKPWSRHFWLFNGGWRLLLNLHIITRPGQTTTEPPPSHAVPSPLLHDNKSGNRSEYWSGPYNWQATQATQPWWWWRGANHNVQRPPPLDRRGGSNCLVRLCWCTIRL